MEQKLGHLIKGVHEKIKCKLDAELKSRNLTMAQGRIIAFISRNGGSATQKQIESFLGISHPSVVGIISRMERNGHIVCNTDEEDRRYKRVELTESAINLRNDIEKCIMQNEKKMLEFFSDEEIEKLRHMLSIIYNNL